MKEQYAGIIRAPDAWWLSKSKLVYDGFDMPEGPVRDLLLSVAQARGDLIRLGPGTMTSAQAVAAAKHAFGEEVTAEHAFDNWTPLTDKGRDLVNGTGIFGPGGGQEDDEGKLHAHTGQDDSRGASAMSEHQR